MRHSGSSALGDNIEMKKEPRWIKKLENREWVEANFFANIEFWTEEQFRRELPIIVSKEFRDFKTDDPQGFITELARYLCTEARIGIRDVEVELFKEDKASDILSKMGMEYSVEEGGTAGIFHSIDASGTAKIAIEEHNLADYSQLLGTLSHELAHVFMHLKRPPEEEMWEEEEEEPLTDIMAIMLGFGLYICNSQERFAKTSEGAWSTSWAGYLSLEECCVTQALTSYYFKQDFKKFKKYLYGNPKEFVSEAIDFFSSLSQEDWAKRVGGSGS